MSEYTEDEKALIDATQWPAREADVTADALIVHGARLTIAMQANDERLMRDAFALDRESPDYKPAMRAYMDAVTGMIAEAQVVLALIAVQEDHGREAADAIALRLWEITEDGGVIGELMWGALDDRKINAEAVFELARKEESTES